MGFDDSWKRLKDGGVFANYSRMAEFLERQPCNITESKKRGNFPLEWAYKIAQANKDKGVTTEWVMTGEGPEPGAPPIEESKEEVVQARPEIPEIKETKDIPAESDIYKAIVNIQNDIKELKELKELKRLLKEVPELGDRIAEHLYRLHPHDRLGPYVKARNPQKLWPLSPEDALKDAAKKAPTYMYDGIKIVLIEFIEWICVNLDHESKADYFDDMKTIFGPMWHAFSAERYGTAPDGIKHLPLQELINLQMSRAIDFKTKKFKKFKEIKGKSTK